MVPNQGNWMFNLSWQDLVHAFGCLLGVGVEVHMIPLVYGLATNEASAMPYVGMNLDLMKILILLHTTESEIAQNANPFSVPRSTENLHRFTFIRFMIVDVRPITSFYLSNSSVDESHVERE